MVVFLSREGSFFKVKMQSVVQSLESRADAIEALHNKGRYKTLDVDMIESKTVISDQKKVGSEP